MSTELEQRLRRLAPEVDVDRGRADLEVRQRRITRRHRIVGGTVLAVSVVAIAGLAGQAARDRSPGSDDVTTAAEEAVDAGPPRTTSASLDGVEVTVSAPDHALAGTRLWFDVTVRNEGDAPTYWEAGGCAIPVEAAVGPSSTSPLDTPQIDWDAPRWDGEVDGLGAWLTGHNALASAQRHQPADRTGTRAIACQSDSHIVAVAPGDALQHRGSVELRVPPGPLPDGGDYRLVVSFSRLPGVDASPVDDSLPPVVVRAPLTLTDDPGRTADGGAADAADAVAAFAADPRLAGWVASTEVADRPDLVQDFSTELSWWRDGWELWVEPQWEGSHLLRMRYDPGRDEIVDVRTVYLGQAPGDEPGRNPVPGETPDEIL